MAEYWIVCFSSQPRFGEHFVAGPWYGWKGKRAAKARLEKMKTDDNEILRTHPWRCIVKTVKRGNND